MREVVNEVLRCTLPFVRHRRAVSRSFGALVLGFALSLVSHANAAELAPFKDRLFAYPKILSSTDGGAFRSVDYREARDIDRRDQVPERRVKRQYVDLATKRVERHIKADNAEGLPEHYGAGNFSNPSIITVFIHGRGGDWRLGANDFSFGGNFNRIKNLMMRAGGLYLSPSAGDFGADEARRVATLIRHYHKGEGRGVVLACGSAGGDICHRLAQDQEVVKRLSGLLFLGSFGADSHLGSVAARMKIPVFIGHGSRDTVFAVETMETFYRRLRDAGVPARMVRFETGTHGTPIRMTDWRETINWVLSH